MLLISFDSQVKELKSLNLSDFQKSACEQMLYERVAHQVLSQGIFRRAFIVAALASEGTISLCFEDVELTIVDAFTFRVRCIYNALAILANLTYFFCPVVDGLSNLQCTAWERILIVEDTLDLSSD